MKKLYLDNSASTFPKPNKVIEAINFSLRNNCSNSGRSGHLLSADATSQILDTRIKIMNLFNNDDPLRTIFSYNSTLAINQILHGLVKPKDHIIISDLEHNAVTRPAFYLKETKEIDIDIFKHKDSKQIETLINPKTRCLVVNHISNVSGQIQNLNTIGQICKKYSIVFIVDASQSAGCTKIDIKENNIDLLAFTGHKYLLGPQGIGGMVINSKFDISKLDPLILGGTGSNSESYYQPSFLPDKYESGTMNLPAINGLGAALDFINDRTIDAIEHQEKEMVHKFIDILSDTKNIQFLKANDFSEQAGTVSFNIINKDPADIALELEEDYGILTRSGLHCAPLAHQTYQTLPLGAIRISFSCLNSLKDVQYAAISIKKIAQKYIKRERK